MIVKSLEPFVLREEAAKFWECCYCDELVYLNQSPDINISFPFFVTEKNTYPRWWELWMRSRDGYLHCAIIEPFVGAARNGWDSHFRHHRADRDNTMLRKIAKGVKYMKRVCLSGGRVGWPCHIRLQVFDDSSGILRYVTKDSVKTTPSLPINVSIVADGELDSLGLVRGFAHTFDEGKLPKQIIQARPKIIQEVTSQKTKTQIRGFRHLQPNNIPLILRIEVGSGNTWLARIKNSEGLVETIQMFCRPINLQPYVIGGDHMLYYPQL